MDPVAIKAACKPRVDDDTRGALMALAKALVAQYRAISILSGSLDTLDQFEKYKKASDEIATRLDEALTLLDRK